MALQRDLSRDLANGKVPASSVDYFREAIKQDALLLRYAAKELREHLAVRPHQGDQEAKDYWGWVLGGLRVEGGVPIQTTPVTSCYMYDPGSMFKKHQKH